MLHRSAKAHQNRSIFLFSYCGNNVGVADRQANRQTDKLPQVKTILEGTHRAQTSITEVNKF